jgi:hypothetical protein
MVYLLSFIFIIGLIVFIYLLFDMALFSKKDQNSNISEIEPRDIEQDILVEIAQYEKFLYKKGFVRRDILTINKKNSRVQNYKFYYYSVVDGIHAFLEVYKIGNSLAVNYFFVTLYRSGNYTLSTRFVKQIDKRKMDKIYIHKHSNLDIKELYLMHSIDREKENETILKKRLSIEKLLNLPIFIKSLNIKQSKKVKEVKLKSSRNNSISSKLSQLINQIGNMPHIGRA